MANNIDERIVAAKFDASDFEKGVNKTIKKLDELKKSLDLKDATKGVKELAEKTEASTDSMSKSLEKLTDRFTTFVGMIKQRILGGLADEVAGVFLRMEQSVTGFIRSISSDQVGAGMAKYEQMLTSVRMMMAAGESQSSAYGAIDTLREYSDQTSYSLSQMTDALSKMRAAGVDIDTATKSVEGIANACANAGVNATEAQRAFYNLSQAYAKGSLNYTDYKSLELLNMTTEKFKENMLEAAVEAGTLKKLSDGVYQTISTTDKKVKAGKKVTIKNATDMLKYDYMNTRAMNILFGKKFYFDETAFREYKKKWTDKNGVVDREKAIEEAKKDFGQIAVDSYLAAREARSFTDVINTLKDVVSTGWSTTFENLFGKLDEAVDFFTKLTEGDLAEAIYRVGEWRNEVLETWNVLNAEGKGTGGELFRQTILNLTDSLGILIQTFEDILPDSESFGESLLNTTYSIRDFSIRVRDAASNFRVWMNSPMFENGPTRIEKIRSILGNLAKVFGIVARVAGSVISAFSKMLTPLESIFDSMIGVDDIIVNLQMALEPVSKVLEKVVGFLGDVAAFFVSMAVDTFGANVSFVSDLVGILMELFTGNSAQKLKDGEGVLDRIKNDFEGIKQACQSGLSAVKEFFESLISDIRNLLGLTDESEKKAENQNGGIFANLINFFDTNQFVQDAKKWVDQAIVDVDNFIKSIPSRVMEFGANIYDTLRKLFFKDESDKTDNKTETESILTPLGEWVNQAIIDIKEFFSSLPQRIIEGVGTITNWVNEVFDYWFKPHTDPNVVVRENKNGEWVENPDFLFAPRFEDFIARARISISHWFEDLPNKIRNAFSRIGNFVTNLYKSLDEFLFGKKVRQTISVADGKGGLKYKDITVRYKTGFSKWLDGVIKEIKKFISNIPEYIKTGIKGAGDILSVLVNAIFGKEDNTDVTGKDATDAIAKPFLGIDLNSILTTISDIGREIFNQVIRLFTGTDDLDKNTEWFSNKVAEGIRWIRVKAKEALDWVLEFIGNLPTTIANIFTGENKDKAEQGPIGQSIIEFGQTVGKFISEDLPNTVLTFIGNATTEFDKIWTKLYNTIVGEASEKSEEAAQETEKAIEVDAISGPAPQLTAWQKFVKKLGETIADIWKKLPVWIANGIDLAIVGIDNLISGFGKQISNSNIQKKVNKETEKTFKSTVKGISDSAEEGEASEETALLTAIKGIGERIKNLFIITIPGFISEAWTAISNLGSDIYKGISLIFSNEPAGEDTSELTKMVANVGGKIKDWLVKDLPGLIQPAWNEISGKASEIFRGFVTIFTGEKPEGEIQSAVNSFGTTVYNFITHDIPEAIKKAFDFIGKLFTKNETDTFNDVQSQARGKLAGKFKEAAIKPIAKDVEDIDKEVERPGFWSFVDGIKESLLNAFSSIGPTILNGLSKALEWLNNIGAVIIDVISEKTSIGKEIEKAYGKEKPDLVKSLSNVGENLKTFFIETLPKFIGAAIASLIKNADVWFSNLFGAMSDSAKAEEEEFYEDIGINGGEGTSHAFGEAEFKGAFNFMEILKKIFNSIMDWVGENKTILEIIGVIVALTMLFSKLTDLFGLADEFEEGARVVKWTAITLAIIAISGIMSYISSLVDSGDDKKISNFEKIIDKLAGLFEKIAWIMGLVTAGKLFDALGNKWDSSSKPALDFVGVLSEAFGGFFKAVGIGAGADIGLKLGSAGIDTFFKTITDSLVDMTAGVESMLSFITPFVNDMYAMSDKLDIAIDSARKVGELYRTLISEFMGWYKLDPEAGNENLIMQQKIDAMRGEGRQDNVVEITGERLYESLDTFMKLSVFFKNISHALNDLNSIPDVSEALKNARNVFVSEDFLGLLTDLLTEIATAFGSSGAIFLSDRPLSVMSYGLDILADTMSVFGNSLKGFTSEDVNTLSSVLQVLFDLAEALKGVSKWSESSLAKAFGSNSELSEAGRQIKVFGEYMKDFYGYILEIPGFKGNEVNETNSKISSVIKLMRGAAEAAAVMSNVSLGDLDYLGEKMPALGHNLATMFNSFNTQLEVSDVEKLKAISSSVQSVASVFYSLSQMNVNGNTGFFETVSTIFNKMSEEGNYTRLAEILSMMSDAIITSLTNKDSLDKFQETGNIIAKSLITGIQLAINSDPTLRITPVLNLDTAKSQIRELFGIEEMGNVDLSGLANAAKGANDSTDTKIIDYTMQLSDINNSIGALSRKLATVEDVGNAFSRMTVVLDSGQLVGGLSDRIDSAIGEKLWFITRGNAVSITGP